MCQRLIEIIGSKTLNIKMTAVDKIFQNVILGIRAMRLVNLASDCAELRSQLKEMWQRERIPFISQSPTSPENC